KHPRSMIVLLLIHLAVGVGVIGGGRRLGHRATTIAVLPAVATLTWTLAHWNDITGGSAHLEHVPWLPALDLNLDLRIDGFSLLMILLISGIGALLHLYSRSYLEGGGPRTGRLIGLLVLF